MKNANQLTENYFQIQTEFDEILYKFQKTENTHTEIGEIYYNTEIIPYIAEFQNNEIIKLSVNRGEKTYQIL